MVKVEAVIAPDLPTPAGHSAHAIRAGGLLFVSDLLGVRPGHPEDRALDVGAQAGAVLRRLDRILAAAGHAVDVARLVSLGNTPTADEAPEGVDQFLAVEEARRGEVLRSAGVQPE